MQLFWKSAERQSGKEEVMQGSTYRLFSFSVLSAPEYGTYQTSGFFRRPLKKKMTERYRKNLCILSSIRSGFWY